MYCWGERALRDLDGLDLDSQHRRDKNTFSTVSAGKEVVAYVRKNDEKTVFFQEVAREKNKSKTRHFALKVKIHTISCGASHVVVVSTKGEVYQVDCKMSPYPTSCLSMSNKKVIQATCGDHHSIILTEGGQIFTWGSNSNGQLGLGDEAPSYESPQLQSTLAGMPLALIAAGGDHSFALSASGVMFSWGKNSKGQLGLGDVTDRNSPFPVRSLHRMKTVNISCGGEHTAILTKGGVVYTFGSGQYGQLGHNSGRNELWPRLVAELWGSRVTQIACGRNHTLTYVASLKKIYAFGHGKHGQLGNGLTTDQNIPLPVHLSQVSEHDHKDETYQIIAGGNQSFALYFPAQGSENCRTLKNKILTIDDKAIEKWMFESESKSWKTMKTEISQLFSSPSCINGSFLKQSHNSYSTVRSEYCGLDLSLARQSFEKLARNKKVLNQIESVVLQKLLPSLCSVAAGVEGLHVYLVLPELIRVLPTFQSSRDLCVSFAKALLCLHPDFLVVLEGLWSELPNSFFKALVKIFHAVSTHYLHKMWTEYADHWDSVKETVLVLQKLYEVNLRSGRKIEDKNFHISEIKLSFQNQQKIHPFNERLHRKSNQFWEKVPQLSNCHGIFDTETKNLLFWMNNFAVVERDASIRPIRENNLHVNRKSLLEDTINNFRTIPRNYSWPLKVMFWEEDGIDHGGVSQEFFSIVTRELLSMKPTIFEFFEDSRLVWFILEVHGNNDLFFLLGVLCGMALYNLCIVNFHFPLALFKKLLDIRPTLEDLEELSPTEARSLKNILEVEEDLVDELYLDFTAKGQELVRNGRNKFVDKFNRHQYVNAYVDFVFNVSVEWQFKEFARGFLCGCPNKKWRMFLPEELLAVLSGNTNYEWDEMKKNTKYIGYEASDEIINNFWIVFTELSEQEKKNFLSFMTGSDRLPIGGLSKVFLKIMNVERENPDIYYPMANTCYTTLYLPNYSSIHILRKKLLHAIQHYEEFGER